MLSSAQGFWITAPADELSRVSPSRGRGPTRVDRCAGYPMYSSPSRSECRSSNCVHGVLLLKAVTQS